MLRPTAALLCLCAIFAPSYGLAMPQAVVSGPGRNSGVQNLSPTPTTTTPAARATTSPSTTSTSSTSSSASGSSNRGIRTYVSNGTTYQEPIADPTAAPARGRLGVIGPAVGDALTDVVPETTPAAVGSFQSALAALPPTSTYTTPETITPRAATTTDADQPPAVTLVPPPPPVVKREIEVEVEARGVEFEVEMDTSPLVVRDLANGTQGYFDDGHQTHSLLKRQTISNIFTPIGTSWPSTTTFVRRRTHPVAPQGVTDTNKAIHTNKFYSNFFLGTRNNPTFTLPYEIWWSKEPNSPWGLSFDHRDPEDIVYGDPKPPVNAREWYANPVWVRSLSFSAKEFVTGTSSMEMGKLGDQSAELTLYPNKATSTAYKLVMPICQGMGFVSGVYYSITPAFDSNVFFKRIEEVPFAANANVRKIRIFLEDNSVWTLYAWPNGSLPLDLNLVSTTRLEASRVFRGLIQVGKVSNNGVVNTAAEAVYDAGAGSFCTGVALSGGVSGSTGNYRFTYTKATFNSTPLLMFALPHHLKSFDSATAARARTGLRLTSSSKGMMTAISADSWTMVEAGMPTNIGWMPVKAGTPAVFAARHLTRLSSVAKNEIAQDMSANTNLDSMYFSGKALAKYAYVCLSASEVLKDSTLTVNCLNKLKTAFNRFVTNKQKNALVYEASVWRGIVSDAMYKTGDPMADFGSGFYNDHHFHYGYFIQTGAIIAFLDKKWQTGAWLSAANKEWVNTLVRDVANPSAQDVYYPVFRSFDWFHGHSWAKGLFASLDGKDEESSSEDYNFYYAMKLWGNVIGDTAMEARGNLMLAILKRSINEYMLLGQGKNNQPALFEGNLVTGILWENKAHHTTWFSVNNEAIHGIHMLPLTPISAYVRSSTFVQNEWNQYFRDTINTINDGWKGIIWANVALFNPTASFNFFIQSNFPLTWIDGGASKTWYMAFAGSLGGAAS